MASSEGNTYKVEVKKDDLETLLRCQFDSDLVVQSFTTKPLTNPGDNYGSTILAVEVRYQKGKSPELYKLPIVAKLVPESPFLLEVFNIEITFNKEVRIYTLVAPAYESLQKESGIPESDFLDVFPKYYGSRPNKQNDITAKADESAVLLMENLKISGYEMADRRKGFNLKHMAFIVSNLAKFHALAIALKILKPQIFKETVLMACENFELGGFDEEESDAWIQPTIANFKIIIECVPYIKKIEQSLQDGENQRKEKSKPPPREPFATIVHNDFWVNNMMFKYDNLENNSEVISREAPSRMKFVDFQVTLYDSPVKDLVFLLCTSLEVGLLEEHIDHLLQLYHKEFTLLLSRVGCDIKPFSFELFQEELNIYAPLEFPHIIFMLNPLCADSKNMGDMKDVSKDSVLQNTGGEVYNRRAGAIIKVFAAKGWL